MMTESMFLEPSNVKKLNPVSSRAKITPFFSVLLLIEITFLNLKTPSIKRPITLVIQTKENLDTESGTFCKKTYCIAARNVINENFAIINADDFYGNDSYLKASEILENLKITPPYEYAMVGYQVKNTLTENGSVKRGLCKVENNKLVEITECSIEKNNDTIIATPLSNEVESFKIDEDAIVSMNLLLFTPTFFPHLEKEFHKFLEKNKEDLSKVEFFIPDAIFNAIKEDYASVIVEPTTSKWYGVTYKEDANLVKDSIKELVLTKKYPNNLWK